MQSPVPFAFLATFCLSASAFDLRSGKIPNALNLTGLLGGFLLSSLSGSTKVILVSLGGALLGAAILIVPFLLRMVGGGDLKFLCAAGAIVGPATLWHSFLAGALFGGLGAIFVILKNRHPSERLSNPPRETPKASAETALQRGRRVFETAEGLALRRLLEVKPLRSGETENPNRKACRGSTFLPYTLPLSAGLLAVTSLRTFR